MSEQLPVLCAYGLTKRYGRSPALSDCTLDIPARRVVGLVGPNGAGKTTLLRLAVGMLRPTSGSITVLGRHPGSDADQLARVGFVAQGAPIYADLTVADHLRLGAHMNVGWDHRLAADRIATLGLDPAQKAGQLSGGQAAQLALTMALAKQPDLLVLDEPVASLDPLARREFLQSLMAYIAEYTGSVLMSSHLVSDLERVCDHLIVLVDSRVRVSGDVEELLDSHYRLTGARRPGAEFPGGVDLVAASNTDRQTSLIVRSSVPITDPAFHIEQLDLEDLVLAYMSRGSAKSRSSSEPMP